MSMYPHTVVRADGISAALGFSTDDTVVSSKCKLSSPAPNMGAWMSASSPVPSRTLLSRDDMRLTPASNPSGARDADLPALLRLKPHFRLSQRSASMTPKPKPQPTA